MRHELFSSRIVAVAPGVAHITATDPLSGLATGMVTVTVTMP